MITNPTEPKYSEFDNLLLHPNIATVHKFSEKTQYPMKLEQLRFLNGNRGIGKTVARVMEILTYIDEQPNKINWGGLTQYITEQDPDNGLPTKWITMKTGLQNWDILDPIIKGNHTPDLMYIDFVFVHDSLFKQLFRQFFRVISTMDENKSKASQSDLVFRGKPVSFRRTKREIHFQCNHHIIRFRQLSVDNLKRFSSPDFFKQLFEDGLTKERGLGPAEKTFSDLDIQF